MSKHTPGPWSFYGLMSGSENHRGYSIQNKDGWIGDCSPRDENGKEGFANARLIAAAPDLLEALMEAEKILVRLDTLRHLDGTGFVQLDNARVAIAKATS